MFFILLLYLHLSMFFILLLFLHIFFSTSSLTLLWTIVGVFTPHFILSAQPITEWFAILSFFNFSFLPRALRFWVGIFYLQSFFILRSFTDILTCVYQGFPGSRQFFLEVCRASYWSSKHRPSPSVCFIHSNPQTLYTEQFSFKFYHILAWITYGEKFSLQAPLLVLNSFRWFKVIFKDTLNKARRVLLITASMNIKVIFEYHRK